MKWGKEGEVLLFFASVAAQKWIVPSAFFCGRTLSLHLFHFGKSENKFGNENESVLYSMEEKEEEGLNNFGRRIKIPPPRLFLCCVHAGEERRRSYLGSKKACRLEKEDLFALAPFIFPSREEKKSETFPFSVLRNCAPLRHTLLSSAAKSVSQIRPVSLFQTCN